MKKMSKAFKSGLIIFIVLIVLLLALTAAQLFGKSGGNTGRHISAEIKITQNEADKAVKKNKGYIAALSIEGTIEEENSTYNQEWLLSTIDELKNDDKNLGMAIYINSPGGAVYQADEVYLALQDYKTKGKKIYVYQGPMAASGGYYISCAGDKIYANRNTLTGSIGVISGEFYDVSELIESLGIKAETIHSGRNKLMGSVTEPLTDEQREIMQTISDECYNQFCSIVCSQRHIPFGKVHELADGRIYTAYQALENGLIDNIDSWENMLTQMMEQEYETEVKVNYYSYEAPVNVMNMLMGIVSKIGQLQTAATLGIPEAVVEKINSFDSYPAYLYK